MLEFGRAVTADFLHTKEMIERFLAQLEILTVKTDTQVIEPI